MITSIFRKKEIALRFPNAVFLKYILHIIFILFSSFDLQSVFG